MGKADSARLASIDNYSGHELQQRFAGSLASYPQLASDPKVGEKLGIAS